MKKCALVILCGFFLLEMARAENAPVVAEERIVLRTNAGDLVLALYPETAPRHVDQILKLVRLGAYDTTDFFRVDPSYLVQLGEVESRRLPLSEEQQAAVRPIPAEFSRLKHRRGALTMARQDDDPSSARTSFCILLVDSPHLDGKYTVFGQLERGYDVIDEMARVPRDAHNVPRKRIEVLKAEVVSSLEELSNVHLSGPKPIVVGEGEAFSPEDGAREIFAVVIALMVLVSGASFALGGRVPQKIHRSLSLLNALMGGFALFVFLAPASRQNHLYALTLLAGIFGTLKLMGKFEDPP